MTHEHKQQCNQIFSYYGEDHQLIKLKEELTELYEAVERYQDDKSEANLIHLAEEMADVRIMLRQLRAIVGDKVDEFVHFKLDRQLKRIAAEQKPPVCSYTGLE
ncbi:MAG: hypothetical protein UD936_05085, partial [Acutalibacteraceae bacterium]|nr:hypothetical protein [Acutalibacteraceae bacterium]